MAKKKRFPDGSVCKPCWELKYCPYGPLVEYFPWAGASYTRQEVEERYKEAMNRLLSGEASSEKEVWWDIETLHNNQPDDWSYIQQF